MRSVGVAELKSKLSEYLARVRRGDTVTVLDRRTPIARIVPYESETPSLSVRRPLPRARLRQIALPPPLKVGRDVVKLLLEERQGER